MNPERWQRIEQLYHAALERAANQRSAFLAEASADDDGLRREVEVLLAANEQAGGFLATPALEQEAKELAAENRDAIPTLQVGQELSHYKILARIGAGGMGEVFLARDTILERRVALKLLPVQFTQDAGRLERFVREARAASALNHPNIITIYEIGEVAAAEGTTHFIATEFIEGKTLRSWRVDEEQRLRQSLNIAVQVASALDAAHAAGIVHRDIKPDNVMVRPDGLVKVLDFGLAKLTTRLSGSADTKAQTLIEVMKTRPGVILGTVRYMSPEQARGHDVDERSDIFSLGVVLYEMLTRRQLFAGDTDADIVAAIIRQEAPPLTEHLSDVPPELERIVQKALAKDIDQRYQNARDLQIDLQALMRDSESSARLARSGSVATGGLSAQASGVQSAQISGMLTAPRFSLRHLLLGLPVLILVAATLLWLTLWRGGKPEAPPFSSLKTVEAASWTSAPGDVYSFGSLSPDAKRLAYSSAQTGSKSIWVKSTLSGEPSQITTDEFKNDNPIWSPDGEYIAFFSLRGNRPGIWRISYFSGTPTEVTQLDDGAVTLRYWSKSDKIYYELKSNLFAFNVTSKQATQITSFDSSKLNISAINISPDEDKIAYVTRDENGSGSLWFMPTRGASAVQVASDISEIRDPVWHTDGKRILYSANVDGIYQIFVAYTDGRKPTQVTFGDKDAFALNVAADGTKILYGSSKEESDIWGVRVAQGEEFTITSGMNSELWPDASPDGKTIAFQSIRSLSQGDKLQVGSILTKPANAEAQPFELAASGFLPKWSPDGKQLAFMRETDDKINLFAVKATGGGERQLTTEGVANVENTVLPYNRYQNSYFSWSFDSSTIVYCARRNLQRNLWLVSADGSKDTQITNNRDGDMYFYCPLWSADDKRIAYTTSLLNKLAYEVFVMDPETKEARGVLKSQTFLRLLGWSADGEHLILATVKGKPTPSPTEVYLVEVAVATGEQHPIEVLQSAYLYNIHLSADKNNIAFASHQDRKDNIWATPASGGKARKLTANNDPRLYFSSLSWSPDGKEVYFGKQSRFSLLSMITNFK